MLLIFGFVSLGKKEHKTTRSQDAYRTSTDYARLVDGEQNVALSAGIIHL